MNAALDPELQLDTLLEDMAAAQTRSLYRRSGLWLIPTLAAAGLLAYVLKDHMLTQYYVYWFTSILVVNLYQLVLLWLFHQHADWEKYHFRWRQALTFGWFCSGTIWGVATVVLIPDQSAAHQAFVALIITGLTVGLVPALSIVPSTSLGFLFTSMGPLVFTLIWQPGSDLQEKIGHVLLIILVAMAMLSLHIAKTATKSLQLNLDNKATLKKAKILNETLKEEIRERWSVEQELKRARDEAESAALAKGDFLATMSHEIRTPMNGVLGMLELLKEMDLDEEQRDLAETAHYSAESLLSIINDVLDFSKIEMGELELENIEFNLLRTMKDVSALMKRRAEEKGIYVHLDRLQPGISPVVVGDPTRLRQILTNLVGNAVKFTDKGGVDVSVTLMRRSQRNLLLRFEVRDTGIGIAQHTLDKLFQPFAQADSSMARKYGGSGLGLSIAKHLVTLMGGQIGVETRPVEGSLFWFTVPFQIPGQAQTPARQNVADTQVLLVGTDGAERKAIEELLRQLNVKIDTARTSGEALQKMTQLASIGRSWLHEVVILCPSIGDGGQQQFIEHLGRDPILSGIAIIAYTPPGGPPREALSLDMVVWLSLPANKNDLFRAIAENTAPGSGDDNVIVTPEKIEILVEDPPVFEKVRQEKKPDSSPAPTIQPDLPSSLVLVVEDNLVNQKVAKSMLTKLGMKVDLASDGREALEKTKEKDYSVVFMDCQMPEMDGFEATRRIREREHRFRHPSTPIVAMTANAMEGDRERCLDSGMNDYLPKPVTLEALSRLLRQYLREKSSPDSQAGTRLLLIEDNPVNQKVAVTLVQKMGLHVDTASDGFEGVAAAQKGDYAAILMDCQMPGMDGYDATRKIRAWEKRHRRKHTPIIAVTANAMEGDRDRCIESGMDDYLAKPITREKLSIMLEKWLPENDQEAEENAMTPNPIRNDHQPVDIQILDDLKAIMADDFMDLVHVYLNDAPQRLKELHTAIKDSDADALKTSAHTLKSSSANLGAMHLSELAKQMEMIGRSGTTRGSTTLFNQAVAEYKQVKQALKKNL